MIFPVGLERVFVLAGARDGELGRADDARALFEGMLAYAEKRRATPFKIDYFATSLPLLLYLHSTSRVEWCRRPKIRS